jgi:hypothetical protein
MKENIKNAIAWVRYYQLNLFLFFVIGWLIFLVVVGVFLALWAPDESVRRIHAAWEQEMAEREADPAWQAEQERLHRKHGKGYGIIYEPGQEPYYHNDRGERCRFI